MMQKVACTAGAIISLSIFLLVGWERGQVWAHSKVGGGNKDNVKINSIIVCKICVLCK